jgi:catechol 2,3-dioxygenase-like lactoylglutathione lyase family enzyme
MQIRHVIIKADDQQKALSFYTSVVGFVKKLDVPIGGVRWLTVSSPEGAEGVELVLEPNNFPPARASQNALYDAGFPAAVFTTNDILAEYHRLRGLGVTFRGEPKSMGPVTTVPFEDTCGNLIMLVQPVA